MWSRIRVGLGLVLLLAGIGPGRSWAHPFLQNSWRVVVEDGRLVMRASATLREVMVIQGLQPAGLTNLVLLQEAVSKHASYVASNLVIEVEGGPLPVEVLDHQLLLDAATEPEESDRYPDLTHAAYDLECLLPAGVRAVRFRHTTLRGHSYSPGIPWEPSYVLMATDRERRVLGQDVLRAGGVVALALGAVAPVGEGGGTNNGTASGGAGRESAMGGGVGAGLWGFLRQGVHHVATGYDHLLFLAALALAARTWGRLLAIVGVFTLAHSVTVTLAAMGWVRVPSAIVEPVIAGSIVWVALENVLVPRRAAGGGRLLVAFGFGLVHGLGFAGGLREVLEALPGSSLAVAIIGFCAGVELGHVAIGAPFFGLIRAVGAGKPAGDASGTGAPVAEGVTGWLRWGSVGVAAGGAWFLWAALRAV